jgi:hypothetical protein
VLLVVVSKLRTQLLPTLVATLAWPGPSIEVASASKQLLCDVVISLLLFESPRFLHPRNVPRDRHIVVSNPERHWVQINRTRPTAPTHLTWSAGALSGSSFSALLSSVRLNSTLPCLRSSRANDWRQCTLFGLAFNPRCATEGTQTPHD